MERMKLRVHERLDSSFWVSFIWVVFEKSLVKTKRVHDMTGITEVSRIAKVR